MRAQRARPEQKSESDAAKPRPRSGAREKWGWEDSNLRRLSRRFYRPLPLAARAHPQTARHCSLIVVRAFDAVVVGAGPAGSTAAYRLARGGASVLLADKAAFPRDKPCGGGLTMRAVRQLPFSVEPVVEDRTTRVRLGLDFTRRVERQMDEPLVLMTQRKRL